MLAIYGAMFFHLNPCWHVQFVLLFNYKYQYLMDLLLLTHLPGY